uniref:Uncharacterized protein n=1 Tax=Acrobeloides nanus TaxID=290746 RepID=A0A914BZ79_9BILA
MISDNISTSNEAKCNFWTITLSVMLKLIALVVTIISYFWNEWIVTEGSVGSDELLFMRGLRGIDCVRKLNYTGGIECNSSYVDRAHAFWDPYGITEVREPHTLLEMARVFFYLLIIAGIADFIITLAICFRQQQELGRFSNAKKASLAASSALIGLYLWLLLLLFLSKGSGTFILRPKTYNDAHFGSAYTLFFWMFILALAGVALTAIPYIKLYRRIREHQQQREVEMTRRLTPPTATTV